MKKSIQAVYAWGALIIFMGVMACSSDDSNRTPDPVQPTEKIKVPSAVAFSDLRKKVLDAEKQVIQATINEEGGFSFTSKKGVKVDVRYLGILEDDIKQGDEVVCTFIELYDKGVMALANRPTMGIYPNREEGGYFEVTKDEYGRISTAGYRGFIITGGEFYFDIQVKGKQVTQYGINLDVPAAHTGGFQEDMLFWQGNLDEQDDLTFTEIPIQTEMGFLHGDAENSKYVIGFNGWNNLPAEIGWSNIDKYVSEEGEKTQFFVQVPEGYNYSNAAVYLGVKKEQGLAHLDVFVDYPTIGEVFTEHYGWVPIGLEGYVFFISVDPTTAKVVYAIKEIKVEKNKKIVIESQDLKLGTTEEVIRLLNELS